MPFRSVVAASIAFALAACSTPAPTQLADAIRANEGGLVSSAVVRHEDSGGDYVEVTLRAGATKDDAHGLWCRTIVPHGGISEYDAPSSGTYVATLDSGGTPLVFPIDCP